MKYMQGRTIKLGMLAMTTHKIGTVVMTMQLGHTTEMVKNVKSFQNAKEGYKIDQGLW
jgi:hypothetical protein